MPRPREFDSAEVIDKAIEVFWQKGYESTSVQDLVDTMGINRASIYGAFGSKGGLFAAAMERYIEQGVSKRVLEAPMSKPVRELLADIFDDIIRQSVTSRGKWGCLVTNAAVERIPCDAPVTERVRSLMGSLEDNFCERFALARDAGEVGADKDPRALARFTLNSLNGMRVMSKVFPDETTLRDIKHVVLGALE